MERRRFVGSVVVGIGAVVAGCAGRGFGGASGDSAVADGMVDWELNPGRGEVPSAEADPSIRFDPPDDRVVVEGAIVVGSSSCNMLCVERVTYDDDVLRVAVRSEYVAEEKDKEMHVCTDDVVVDDYEVAVTFDDGLPARVVATERDGRNETRRTVRER